MSSPSSLLSVVSHEYEVSGYKQGHDRDDMPAVTDAWIASHPPTRLHFYIKVEAFKEKKKKPTLTK